jgi:hypothetical protein
LEVKKKIRERQTKTHMERDTHKERESKGEDPHTSIARSGRSENVAKRVCDWTIHFLFVSGSGNCFRHL